MATKDPREEDNFITSPIPDLVICHILRCLPMKFAIRKSLVSKQWERALWPCGLPLDLDEEEFSRDDKILDEDQHKKFISLVESCLKAREKDEVLHKLKLRTPDASLIDKGMRFGLERNVKELDISLGTNGIRDYLPESVFVTKSLTSLILESVSIKANNSFKINLPSLKTMSLKSVVFSDKGALSGLISGCPGLEDLSVTQPCFNVPFDHIKIDDLEKLESFTWYSTTLHSDPTALQLCLIRCRELKYVNVNSRYDLVCFHLSGCQESLRAKIDTRNLKLFGFSGTFTSDVSMKAPELKCALIGIYRELALIDEWKHFSELRDVLSETVGSADSLRLYIRDDEAFIFPENFVKICSPPFMPKLRNIHVSMYQSPTEAILSKLKDSLAWMAPDAQKTYNL